MSDENEYTGRGGRRPGAGRPRTYSKLMAFRVQKDVAAYIEQHPNKSKFIQTCVVRNMIAERSAHLKNFGDVVPASEVKPVDVPMVDLDIVAGFPIPLDNNERAHDTDMLKVMCPHPESTYLIRVKGNSMIDADIHSGDVLVVDRNNREPSEKEIAICELNHEYTVKRVKMEGDRGYLIPANPDYPQIEIKPTDEFHVWGVVTYIIHKAPF